MLDGYPSKHNEEFNFLYDPIKVEIINFADVDFSYLFYGIIIIIINLKI